MKKKLIYETDWLATIPVFYDLSKDIASASIKEVVSKRRDLSFHPEGLYNYLDFGYSILGQTPLLDVQFLRYSSKLWRREDGGLEVEELPDPCDDYENYRLSEGDVIDLIRERVHKWEASLPGDQEIVLPLSGGFDSRLLLWCLREPSRVRAYTYGLSSDQDRSTEVVHARALAERFKLRWERIPLGSFHQYFDAWDAEFSISTHAHGMYHFEFYSKIRETLKSNDAPFLSGIIGDAWAGSISPRQIYGVAQLGELGHAHGLRANTGRTLLSGHYDLRHNFWNQNRERIGAHRFQVIASMRFKMILLSYLIRVPCLFDFRPWSPYLDIQVAMAMLNLPQKRRANRQWQRDFFAKVGLDLENQGLTCSNQNNLNFQALRRIPLRPLNRNILADIIEPSYVDWINSQARISRVGDLQRKLAGVRKVGGLMRRINLGPPPTLEAYCAYLCLKPIETLMLRHASVSSRFLGAQARWPI